MRTYEVSVRTCQSDITVRGNAMASGDTAFDKGCEDEILSRLDSGDVWAWARVTVTATCDKCGAEGSDNLDACSYENEYDFTQGAYYPDMVATAKEECRSMCTCHKPRGTHAI